MSGTEQSQTFQIHSLALQLVSDHGHLLRALQRRLTLFPSATSGSTDWTMEFHWGADDDHEPVLRPTGEERSVYDPPVGEFVYFPDLDQIYIEYEDWLRFLCKPESKHSRLVARTDFADNVWPIAHSVFGAMLMEIAKRHGLYSVHAAGLAVKGKAVLLAGICGAGKSTLTLALLRAGFGFLGDDLVFLSPHATGVRALAFPDEIDVADDTARLFPELRFLLDQPRVRGWHKRPLRPETVYDIDVVWDADPKVLIFPRVSEAPTSRLTRMDPMTALIELAPNVLLTEVNSSQAHLNALAKLVEQCACYQLETGRDFETVAATLRDLLEAV